jgi:hypothetical protein
VGDLAVPRVARALAVLDHDDDGRLDLVVTFNGDRARLFANAWPEAGRWIGFELVPRGGRSPVGARVTVEVAGRRLVREAAAGSSYQSSHDPRLHFGLGASESAERVLVRWPDGSLEEHAGLAAGRYYRWTQGAPPVPRR